MPSDPPVWDHVRELAASAKRFSPQTSLILVANVKTGSPHELDYEETSVTTEYFSSSELTQLMAGFREVGFFVTYYGGELEFINADLKGELDRSERDIRIVYSTAQSGIGVGRKALIPAYCARRNILVCNSDPYVVSLARHKFHVHCVLRRVGLPTAQTWLFHPQFGWLGGTPERSQRLIAKAAFESASIGLTKDSLGEPGPVFEQTLTKKCSIYDQPFVVQQFIEGYEVEVPLIELDKMRALDVVSITLDGNPELRDQVLLYDIVEKDSYDFAPTRHLQFGLCSQIMRTAELAAEALGMRGIGRIDFRVDEAGQPYVTDVATSPHLVRHGAFAKTFEWHGIEHAEMLAAMVGANARRWGVC